MTNLTPRYFLILSAALLLLGAGWIAVSASLPGGSSSHPGIPAPQTGFQAPDFTLRTLEGESSTFYFIDAKEFIKHIIGQ